MVEPHSSNFRVITTNFLGVRIFRKFTVYKIKCKFQWLIFTTKIYLHNFIHLIWYFMYVFSIYHVFSLSFNIISSSAHQKGLLFHIYPWNPTGMPSLSTLYQNFLFDPLNTYELHHEKTCFCHCDQQRCRSACTSVQSDQHLCCSLPR